MLIKKKAEITNTIFKRVRSVSPGQTICSRYNCPSRDKNKDGIDFRNNMCGFCTHVRIKLILSNRRSDKFTYVPV